MRTLTQDETKEILRKHGMWLRDEEGGERADLRGADLQRADLQGAYLRGADLRGADLQRAYLQGADLRGADLRGADLQGADLRGADLQRADLQGADLRGADLRGAYGQNQWVKSMSSDIWDIVYTYDRMQIGCESHLLTEWWSFDDARISRMDSKALEFWSKWKPILQQIIQIAPALPTKEEVTT